MGSCCSQKKNLVSPIRKNSSILNSQENIQEEELKFSQQIMNESMQCEQETFQSQNFKIKRFVINEIDSSASCTKQNNFNRFEEKIEKQNILKLTYKMMEYSNEEFMQKIISIKHEINIKEILLNATENQLGFGLLLQILDLFQNLKRIKCLLLFVKNENISDKHIDLINKIIYSQPYINKISLHLQISKDINSRLISEIEKCQNLLSLDLSLKLEDGFKQGLGKSLSKLKRLERLKIDIQFESDVRFFGEIFYGISQIESLKEIQLYFYEIEYRELKQVIYYLKKLPSLTKLTLNIKSVLMIDLQKSDVLQYILPEISTLINLTYLTLNISQLGFTIDLYKFEQIISRLNNLTYLNLQLNQNIFYNKLLLNQQDQLDFSNCKNLQKLKLDFHGILSDKSFIPHIATVITKCDNLQSLKLSFSQGEELKNEFQFILDRLKLCLQLRSLTLNYQCQDYYLIRSLQLSQSLQKIKLLRKVKMRLMIFMQEIQAKDKIEFYNKIIRKCIKLVELKLS